MTASARALDLVTPLWSNHLSLLILKATLIVLVAFAISAVLQRASASTRHLVWLVALGALLAAPVLIGWAPLGIPILPVVGAGTPTTHTGAGLPASAISGRELTATAAPFASAPVARTVSTSVSPPGRPAMLAWVGEGAPMIGLLWAAGVLFVLGGLASSLLVVRRIVRDAQPLDDPTWQALLVEAADRLGLDETPQLLVACETHMPFGCGVFAPAIVLPETSHAWSEDRRRAVLLHELAHIRRHDLLGHMLGRMACACYWFHPLVWMAAKRLRTESERACDDLAVTSGTHAADYAEHLLDIVTAVRRETIPIAALAMARRKEFEGRMLAILDPELPHTSPSRGQAGLLVAGLVLSAGLMAAAAPVPRTRTVTSVTSATSSVAPKPSTSLTEQSVPTGAQMAIPAAPVRRSLVATPNLSRIESGATPWPRRPQTNPPDLRAEKKFAPQSRTSDPQPGTPADSPAGDDRPALLAKVLRTDSSSELRRVAAWGLQDYERSPIAEEGLVAALQHDADANVREMAAWALSNFDGHRDVTLALVAAMHGDASEQVRATSAWALGEAGGDDATDALTAALGDASPDVRRRAAWALGNIQPKQAPQDLIKMLQDHNPETRRLAAWALYQIQDASALPALEAALHAESDKDTQIADFRAIAAMGDKAVDVLRDLLESPDPEIKSMAIRGLAGGDASGPWPWPWPEPRPNP